MDHTAFTLLDVSDFPLVRFQTQRIADTPSQTWTAEMEALVGQSQPFVLVFPEHNDEASVDRAIWSRWLKANKGRLAALCRGIVRVEPNGARRLAMRAQAAAAGKAFGVYSAVAADRQEAEQLAWRLLATEESPRQGE